jgi:PGF-CTERM protein
VLLAALLVLAPVGATVAVTATTAPTVDQRHADHERQSALERTQETTELTLEVVGWTAALARLEPMVNVSGEVAIALDLPDDRVRVDRRDERIEILADRSRSEVTAGLREADTMRDETTIRRGVGNESRDAVAAALRERVARAGLDANTTVTAVGDSQLRIRTTAPERVRSAVIVRGDTSLVAGFPADDGYRRVELVDHAGIETVGSVQQRAGGPPSVPVSLSDAAARDFSRTLTANGLTDSANISSCEYQETPDTPGYCIYTVADGSIVYAASLSPGLADVFRNDEFVEDPRFVVTAVNRSTARRLALTLRTGPLPAPVRVTDATTTEANVTNATSNDGADPNATATPTPTATATDTPTPVMDGTPTPGESDDGGPNDASPADETPSADDATGAGAPGFGAPAALAALLAVAAGLVSRRHYSP